jgi:hypothetical protein
MVPKAPLEATEHGLVPAGEGWFVQAEAPAPLPEPGLPRQPLTRLPGWQRLHWSAVSLVIFSRSASLPTLSLPFSRSSLNALSCSGAHGGGHRYVLLSGLDTFSIRTILGAVQPSS